MAEIQPTVITVDDAKNPILLVRVLRIISDNISSLNNRISAVVDQIKQVTSKLNLRVIQQALQANGTNSLNVTALRGVLADPQPAGLTRYPTIPTGLLLQSIRDSQAILVKNGSSYDFYTVLGGSPNTLIKLLGGLASGGSVMTTDTNQTVTGQKTFNAGTFILAGTGGASQVLKQAAVGGAITVGQLATSDLSDFGVWTTFTPTLGASSGTFTAGTVTTAKYIVIGKTMVVACSFSSCSISATPNILTMTIPGGFTATSQMVAAFPYLDNGVAGVGVVGTTAASTTIQLVKNVTGPNWTTAVSTSDFRFTLTFQIT